MQSKGNHMKGIAGLVLVLSCLPRAWSAGKPKGDVLDQLSLLLEENSREAQGLLRKGGSEPNPEDSKSSSTSSSEPTDAPSILANNSKLTIVLALGAAVLVVVICCLLAHSAMRQKKNDADFEPNLNEAWKSDNGPKHEAWIKPRNGKERESPAGSAQVLESVS
eukprot:gnl/MRDRNA2_/MRDRNA2_58824_c0_seq1.p1 gnl/MRDRNA2_/MRDRNA2_58824_c0~~gnl/MRDRNA2_/MRDRNA2_58824_c0_seq1.p1  ORF type:complete len:164 (+),score=28.51 gnl/MRDRNA2_/MRDRNA2_58824_c0_seq1:111-602(+)